MSNKNFFNGLKQVGRNNLEAWMQYIEKLVPSLVDQTVSALAVEKLLAAGMPKMSLALDGPDLNALTERMYYVVTNPINTPSDVVTTKGFLLVMGERKTNENTNPEVFQLLYTFEPSVALHYRYGTTSDVNAGSVSWNNYRELLKGDRGYSSYEVWVNDGNSGTLQDYYDFLKGEKGDKGEVGEKGDDGLTAYEVWKAAGNFGDESDFFAAITGPTGASIFEEWLENNPTGTWEDFLEIQRGFTGWSPIFAAEIYGLKVLLKITDWIGVGAAADESDKPSVGWYIGGSGYTMEISEAADFRGIQGIQGIRGPSGVITSVMATQVSSDTAPSISLGGTPEERTMHFFIPKGEKGETGNSGTILSASASSIPNGSQPAVILGGVPSARTMHFQIPEGAQGKKGGDGADGKSAYQFWLEEGNTGSIQDFIASFGAGIAVVPPKVYWGSDITGNRQLSSADIGLTFRVTANCEITLPEWSEVDSGWYVHLRPADAGKGSTILVNIVAKSGEEIRGELGIVNGDATIVRSPKTGEFMLVGEVKYTTIEELIALINTVDNDDWTRYWYPNWFPNLQQELNYARSIANLSSPSKTAIGDAYSRLQSAYGSMGLRIAFPSPYVIENGDLKEEQNFGTFTDSDSSVVATHSNNGSTTNAFVPEQPKRAKETIDQVVNNPSLHPIGWLDGTKVFSIYNEVARSGNQLVGFEFKIQNPRYYSVEIPILGEAIRKVGSDTVTYRLSAILKVGLASNLIRVTGIKRAEKLVNGISAGIDEVSSFITFPLNTTNIRVGMYIEQSSKELHFLTTSGELEVSNTFATTDVSSGDFTTTFSEWIDSWGIGEVTSTKIGSPGVGNIVTFYKTLAAWVLEYPDGTKDYAAARLSRIGWVEPARVTTTEVQSIGLKVVTEVNVVETPVWNEPARAMTTEVDSMNLKIVTPTLVRESTWTEPARTTTTTVDAISLKIVTVNQ